MFYVITIKVVNKNCSYVDHIKMIEGLYVAYLPYICDHCPTI